MSAQYVRTYYGVPAKRGMTITVDGLPATIVGFAGARLRIRIAGPPRHPQRPPDVERHLPQRLAECRPVAVYVDDLIDYGALARVRKLPNTRWCHLLADDPEELHRFAARIGLRRSWFQDHGRHWHYDLTPGKRVQAGAAGATEISRAQLAALIKWSRP